MGEGTILKGTLGGPPHGQARVDSTGMLAAEQARERMPMGKPREAAHDMPMGMPGPST